MEIFVAGKQSLKDENLSSVLLIASQIDSKFEPSLFSYYLLLFWFYVII